MHDHTCSCPALYTILCVSKRATSPWFYLAYTGIGHIPQYCLASRNKKLTLKKKSTNQHIYILNLPKPKQRVTKCKPQNTIVEVLQRRHSLKFLCECTSVCTKWRVNEKVGHIQYFGNRKTLIGFFNWVNIISFLNWTPWHWTFLRLSILFNFHSHLDGDFSLWVCVILWRWKSWF